MSQAKVVIDFLADSVRHYREGYAIVAIDVIRATTTAITSVVTGRRCFPVPSIEVALPLAARLDAPLLVGELGGNMPYGFDITNSPAQIAVRQDVERPMILLSSSGTQVIYEARDADAVYLACFRNLNATSTYLADRHHRVAVIGAGTRGEFREEDQMACALVAAGLVSAGFGCEDQRTEDLVTHWLAADRDAWKVSNSVSYLRESAQLEDLAFVETHYNDLSTAFMLKHGEVVMMSANGD